jgi:hypothetical protein
MVIFHIIGLVILGIIISQIFGFLRGRVLRGIKNTAAEQFDKEKFKTGFAQLNDKVKWAKDFVDEFNLRKLIIRLGTIFLIASIIYGVGVYRGRLGKPINVDLNYEKEFSLQLDGQTLHKPKNSNQLELLDKNGNRIKVISAGDVAELQKKLSPFGFQLKPIFVAGMGIGNKGIEGEAGAGVSWLRYFQWRIDSFLTQKGIYPIGVSYKLKKLDNTAIGMAVGKGYRGDNRILGYFRMNF